MQLLSNKTAFRILDRLCSTTCDYIQLLVVIRCVNLQLLRQENVSRVAKGNRDTYACANWEKYIIKPYINMKRRWSFGERDDVQKPGVKTQDVVSMHSFHS